MIRMKAVIGVCALSALAMSAVGVQSASALGTTGFTCKEKKEAGGTGFSDAHCTTVVATGAKFEHVAIPENTVTEGQITGELAKLSSTISGVEVELQATSTLGIASGLNTNSGGENFIAGTGTTTYKGVTVKKPEGKGCKVKTGEIVTKLLKGTSLGQEMFGKLEPAGGTVFAEFTIEGCTIAALNGLYKVEGSIKCTPTGATVVCTHASTTAQGTLKLRGQVAGVDVGTTFTSRANASEPFTPVAATTT